MHVTELRLRAAALACLEAAGITNVEQLVTHSCDELIHSPHFGAMELYEIIRQLNKHGYSLPSIPGSHTRAASLRERDVLRLRIIEGLTLDEIGLVLDLSTSRVRQILKEHFGLSGKPPAAKTRERHRRAGTLV
jgi:DNA-binding CsgD family transcriptional regulator